MEEHECWCFTVVRANGLRLMRSEKSWRPIITVEVDQHHKQETVLGSDGQNPNARNGLKVHHAGEASKVDINVWYLSQSKKKKKRNLVAKASHSLGELMKKQANDGKGFEVRLNCQAKNTTSVSRKGRPQNGASLWLRVRPPLNAKSFFLSDGERSEQSSSTPSIAGSDTIIIPPSEDGDQECSDEEAEDGSWPDDETPIIESQPLLRRRRRRKVKGYAINTDDEVKSESESCSSSSMSSSDERARIESNKYGDDDDGAIYIHTQEDDDTFTLEAGAIVRCEGHGEVEWVAASMLPQYTEKITMAPMSRMEKMLASFTMYSELKEASLDSHYLKVFERLQLEWTYVGGLLVALAAVDTAVFSISPDSVFNVDSYARSAIAGSSMASGLGIACDAWFLLRYNWADLHTFINRARDLYGSYFFFSLSARVPAICMFFSALSLMTFLGLVAFDAWPQGVLVLCFVIGLIMTMQFLVFGAHWCANKMVEGGRRGWQGGVMVVRKMTWTEDPSDISVRK